MAAINFRSATRRLFTLAIRDSVNGNADIQIE
jgi:hypothetical protein